MNRLIKHSLLFLVLIGISSSCTFTKIIVFFKPSVNDHKKVFACDTIPGNGTQMESISSTETVLPITDPLFVNQHSPSNIPPIEQWVPKEEALNAQNLDELLKNSKTNSLIIIKNDTILYERYLNGVSKEEPKVVFSVTKALTATLTAIAAEEGLLSLDQPVADFLPEFGDDERKNITLRHLMGMVSGLKWNDFSNLIRLGSLYYNPNQERFVSRAAKVKYKPESKFVYKSLATQILGICLEKALKRSYASYLEEKIWKPVGMQYDAYMTLDSKKQRNPRTFGGMAITPSDMARFGQLLLNDGAWEGQQIIPKWFIEELKTRELANWFGYSNNFWRNGYETENFASNQQYWGAGYGGQYIFVSPQDNMVLIRTGDKEKNRWSILLGRLAQLIGQGKTDLTDSTLDYGDQFAGTYENETGEKMTLTLTPDRDEYERRVWTWDRDINFFKEGKQHKELHQFDGISLGYKKQDVQTRMYYDLKDGVVQGLYYNSWPDVKLHYFKKL